MIEITENEMGGTCSTLEMRNAYKILLGNYEEEIRLRKHRSAWEDNIKGKVKVKLSLCFN
jgi:hypothetical protein